jgi:hypothetical protein
VSSEGGYASPAAFRRALTDRLRTLADTGPWSLAQLQRQIAYDRLLARLYATDDSWVVKGATALLAREIGVRGTVDVDVYRPVAQAVAERELRKAAMSDVGDWFRFEIGASRPVGAGAAGRRLPAAASVGGTLWVAFHVDLVGSDLLMTGTPDEVPALARVSMPNLEQHGYRAYPLVDHIADKVAATFQRYGTMATPSTRYKDLVDLVAIVTSVSVEAKAQQAALAFEVARRGLDLPSRFAVPDRSLWVRGYPAEARRSLLPAARTLDEALAVVSPFLDPLLAGGAVGRWDPQAARWRPGR